MPGTVHSGGVIVRETNPDLMSVQQWVLHCRDMGLDPIVGASTDVRIHTLKSTTWGWHPPRRYAEDAEAKRLADVANWIWENMIEPWELALGYLGRFALYGFRYAEVMWGVRRRNGRQLAVIDRFADCDPAAHARWLTQDGETLDAVEQYDPNYLVGRVGREGNPTIPADKLLLLTYNQEGTNWRGDGGIYRRCYFDLEAGRHAADTRQVSADRYGSPTPVAVVDYKALTDQGFGTEQIDQMATAAEESAENWTAGRNASLRRSPGITFEFIGGEFQASELNATELQTSNRVRSAFQQTHLGMGLNDSTGSRALSTLIDNLHTRSVAQDADYIAAQLSGPPRPGAGIMARCLLWNFPSAALEKMPVLQHEGLEANLLREMLGVLPLLIERGLVPADAMPDLRRAVALKALRLRWDGDATEGSAAPAGAPMTPAGATLAGPGRSTLEEEARA